jgi:hypothetical protein
VRPPGVYNNYNFGIGIDRSKDEVGRDFRFSKIVAESAGRDKSAERMHLRNVAGVGVGLGKTKNHFEGLFNFV